MDPILRVISYLFKQKNEGGIEETLQSFFENGINFPKFVALSFNVEKIPKFNPNPKTPFHKKINNELAYNYLKQNNQEIRKIDPNYTTQQDKANLLSLILTKQCFNINYHDILSKCSQIVQPLGLIFKEKEDILNVKSLLSLISVLTNQETPIQTKSSNMDELLIQICKKANVPLIIDKTALQPQNQFLFFIQIEIIFDFFSDKIKELTKNSENHLNEPKSQLKENSNQKNPLNSISSDDDDFLSPIENEEDEKNIFNDENDVVNNNSIVSNGQNEQISQLTKQHKKNQYSFSFLYHQDIILNPMILGTINAIGQNCNLYFENFEEAVKKENPTRIVMHILKDDEPSQKALQNIINSSKENQIELVIEFLKTKDPKFKVLLFDFEDPNYIESSSILFYTNLLDFFYLKKSKQEIYDRCYTLLFGKYKEGDIGYMPYDEEYEILFNFSTYERLINFVNHPKCKFQKPSSDDLSQSKVPLLLSEKLLQRIEPNYVPNAFYYQLQLIFDALDNGDSNHRIVELLFRAIRKLSMIKMPKTFDFVQSIRAKNISRILQTKRYKDIISEKRKDGNENQNISMKNSTLKPQIESTYSQRAAKKALEKKESDEKQILKSMFEYDGEVEQKKLFYVDGILCEGKNDHKLWDDFKRYFKKKMKMKTVPYFLTDNGSFNGTKFPVYKLFSYDENINEWVFNNDEYAFLEQDSKYFYNIESIQLISFIETNSYQSFEILKKLYSNQLDNLELKSEKICVFCVCSKFLNELRFDKYLVDKEKQYSKCRPLFLFLYVPENKQNMPNIPSIVFQIYIFLSFISNISIVVFNRDQCSNQIKFLNILDSLYEECKEFFHDNYNKRYISNVDDEKSDSSDDEIYEPIFLKEKRQQLNKINYGIVKRHNKLLVVFNDDDFSCLKANKDIGDSQLINGLSAKGFEPTGYLSFINTKDPSTYARFINNLLKCPIELLLYSTNIKTKFEHIQYFKINNKYVELKFETENDICFQRIEKIVYDKFNRLIDQDEQIDSAYQLQKLQKELYDEFPFFDSYLNHHFNRKLNSMKMKITIDKIKYLKKELELSSAIYMNYLLELIDSRPFWSKDQLDNLKFSHFDFLKEEFLDMIKDVSSPDQVANIYDESKSILDDQIDKDEVVIDELFKGIEDQFKQKIHREVDPQKGTNYTIRERETEREVKVRIQNGGKLEDLLKQDF